jgi:hypothetical protein
LIKLYFSKCIVVEDRGAGGIHPLPPPHNNACWTLSFTLPILEMKRKVLGLLLMAM